MNFFRLDKPAFHTVLRFFQKYPHILQEEADEHSGGYAAAILANLDQYFSVELQEDAHYDLLNEVLKNRGVITKPMIDKWIYQELFVETNHIE